MLRTPTPFPNVGSWGLHIDEDLPVAGQRAELVRIMALGGTMARLSFPLRLGASGNKVVPLDDVKDCTPLSKDEERELADLERALRGTSGRTPKQRADLKRVNALKERLLFSQVAAPQIERADRLARNVA